MMRRVAGPDCPRCGCTQAAKVRTADRWGRSVEHRKCAHCGKEWRIRVDPRSDVETRPTAVDVREPEHDPTQPPPPGVPVYIPAQVPECPDCGGSSTTVTSTQRPIRHHRCKDCGRRFKSMERSHG